LFLLFLLFKVPVQPPVAAVDRRVDANRSLQGRVLC
jgi:hypothetical protein